MNEFILCLTVCVEELDALGMSIMGYGTSRHKVFSPRTNVNYYIYQTNHLSRPNRALCFKDNLNHGALVYYGCPFCFREHILKKACIDAVLEKTAHPVPHLVFAYKGENQNGAKAPKYSVFILCCEQYYFHMAHALSTLFRLRMIWWYCN